MTHPVPATANHQVFDRFTDAVVVLDDALRCDYLNARAVDVIGRSREALLGDGLWEAIPGPAKTKLQDALRQAQTTQQGQVLVDYYPTLQRWFECRTYPSPDGVVVFFHDVSEHKRIEAALRQQQRMLDEAQRVAQMGSWEFNLASGQLTWTRELYRIFGLDENRPANFDDLLARVPEEDRDIVHDRLLSRQPTNDGMDHDFRTVGEDGQVHHLSGRSEILAGPDGRPDRVAGICQDVTARVRGQLLDAGQRDILAGIVAQRPLAESLNRIAQLHEALNPGALCSLLLLDPERLTVHTGAAPSLPPAFNEAINGLAIGDGHGSCGTAAWRRERVVVADIATHPYWAPYRELALGHGLRACWSTPVIGSAKQVLGTFAVYYHEVREPGGDELAMIDRMLDITAIAIERSKLVERLRERDNFFELSSEIYCIFDPSTERIIQANPSFTRVTGFSAIELGARPYHAFVHPDDLAAAAEAVASLQVIGGRVHGLSYRFLCQDDSYRWLEWESVAADDGLVYAVAHDITEHRRAQASLDYAARHDAITHLPHLPEFEARLSEWLDEPGASVTVLFLGIDRFQTINESLGHVMGDDVLLRVAQRLREALHEPALLSRYGGDEFVIAVPALNPAASAKLAAALRAAVAFPIECGDYNLLLTASIGISRSPTHGQSAQALIRRAEAAMNQAKRQGRDSACEFSSAQMQSIEDRLELGSQLRLAIGRNELSLHYQPQFRAQDRRLTGFEALLRWQSAEFGPVSPARFIPIAEDLGLMPEIGVWVVNEACRQARAWLDRGHTDFKIAVNLSGHQLQRAGLVGQVATAINRYGVPPGLLDLELTESLLMENVARVSDKLGALKALGTSLSLDDFGTGYSSLAYLKQLTIDKLKIDQSFVRGLPDDADDAVIARTIVAMAHQLRMVVAAEGVETEAQAAFLHEIGCDELQGYLLGRPVPAAEAEGFFKPAR